MINAEVLNALTPAMTDVKGGTKADLVYSHTVCYQSAQEGGYLFAVIGLKDGRFAAIWQSHAIIVDSLDVLKAWLSRDAVLNLHERTLLRFLFREGEERS